MYERVSSSTSTAPSAHGTGGEGGGRGVRLSVVVPVFNEQDVIRITHQRLCSVLAALGEPYEIVYVDDGSQDETPAILDEMAAAHPDVRVIHFSRNFGHQAAISAGIDHARGDAVVVIDADLQDPPELIPRLVERWQAGYDVVYARRMERQGESWFKRSTARWFYRGLRRLADIPIPLDTGDFRLMDRRVCAVLRALPEHHRFLRGLVAWAGFRQIAVEYVREPRLAGTSKYSLRKMLRLAADAVTSFSYRPLRWPLYAGAGWTVATLALMAGEAWRMSFAHHGISGASLLITFSLLGDGVLLLSVGVLGQYVARIHDEARRRPLYIVREVVGGRPSAQEGNR
ncbi:glycosyltransferase family 2 protein [Alicyclobacillus cellulosilyticus]|nr:glycosyltransferase family 2 protein [Alicyclobacillus cellulosilyticus]